MEHNLLEEKVNPVNEQEVEQTSTLNETLEENQDHIDKFIEEHSIVLEEKKKEENRPVEYVDLGECTVEDREGNIVLDTKEKEDIRRAEEAKEKENAEQKALFEKEFGKNVGKLNHMGYRRTRVSTPNKIKNHDRDEDR